MANENSGRDRYRDNDDARNPMSPTDRVGTDPDTRAEARGDARETVGNNTRGTDPEEKGPEFNDKQRRRDVGRPPSR
jgi:hypothetical protein